MKKISMFWVIGVLSFALVGCNGNDNVDSHKENKTETTKKQETEESKAEKIVNNWIQSVVNDFDYEKQFDTTVYGESDGKEVQSVFQKKPKKKILYSGDELILAHLFLDTQQSAYLALVLEDGNWICTANSQLDKIYRQQLCSRCTGHGVEVIGTHTEQGRYACAICGGTGWTSNTYYDGVLGWQTSQIGCSGCGGSGWLNGAHQVNDYGTCKACNGEGASVIEGELELDEESDINIGDLLDEEEEVEVPESENVDLGEMLDDLMENEQLYHEQLQLF